MAAIQTCLRKSFDWSGRGARPELWWFYLFSVLGSFAVYVLAALLAYSLGLDPAFMVVVYLVVLVALLPAQLGAAVRRLHDTGRSGGWYFISFVPLAGAVVLIVFLCLPGEQRVNRYGDSPASAYVQQ